ncbi:MAG: ATP-binding protein [Succinimonas sp.]|nr:ATP-binding protein [Succinimonas sp.]
MNEVFSGFDIDITIQYKFKTAWDFEKCEATWETREISESFSIQDELKHKHLAQFHEIRNLFRDYSSGSVIKDDRMFFGRDQDIKHVIENIRDESGRIVTNRCVCIYGQTRTGKSSLLYHIKKRLRLSPSNIIVDIGDIGSVGASEAGIKYRILSCLLEEIELEHEDICTILTDSGISMTAEPERNKTDESYFTEQIGKIRSILKRKTKDSQIIILIDEFTYVYDWIKEKKLSENFMKFWKAFITNYDICAIIVGQDHMMKFINDQRFTNAFGAIRTWEVNYLKEPDACKLITMPVSDSPDYAGQYGCTILPEAVNLLVEMTSGSAYLLMNICADFIDYLNERHALTATGGHAEDFLRRNLSKFEERWFEPLFNDKSDLDSDASITANKELLKKLALSYSEHSGVLPDELSLSEEEKERLQSLETRRVVEMKDGLWRITVRLYAEWLRNKFGSR